MYIYLQGYEGMYRNKVTFCDISIGIGHFLYIKWKKCRVIDFSY